MENIKKNWLKILLVSLVGLTIWGILRGFVFKILIPINDPPDIIAFGDSIWVERGLFYPLLIIIGIIFLSLYSIAFIFIEEKLFGNKFIKGLTYGLSFFLIIVAAFFEFYHFFDGKSRDAILAILADGIPLLVTGIILGLTFSTDKEINRLQSKRNLLSIIFISIFFTISRTIFYFFFYPTPLIKQLNSYIYLFLFGITIGITYYFLSQGIKSTHPFKKSLIFGLILGIAWVPLNFFVCIKYKVPFELISYLILLDLTGIISGGLLNEVINEIQ
ncbi:MAG: hypothetical protein ACFFAN_10400 [Promethearchaeota archaeon]